MKTLIICISVHNGNTEKIAKRMTEEINADIKKPDQVIPDDLGMYDIIGFGSGIYNFKHHKSIFKLLNNITYVENKKAFIFSTRAFFSIEICHDKLKKTLLEKNFDIVGEYSCFGLTTLGPAKLVGGINKGKPDKDDLRKAKEFICEISG